MEQHDRRSSPHLLLVGPRVRCESESLLLRSRDRDPDPPLDGLRHKALWDYDAARGSHDRDRAGLHLADLVHAGELNRCSLHQKRGSIFFNPCGNKPKEGDFLTLMKKNLTNLE